MSQPTATATIPEPRDGWLGAWGRFVRPGAARWENAGSIGFAALSPMDALRRHPRRPFRRG
jgi:hypothetical protein